MKDVAYFVEAEGDIERALAASPNAAEFRQAIADALNDIASGLVAHARVSGSQCRRCILPNPYPYSLVYIETDDQVRVVALQHHKRRANYWRYRLPKT